MAVRAQADLGSTLPAASIMLPNMYASPGKYSSANWGARTMALNGSMYGDARSQACRAVCESLPCMTNTIRVSGATVDVRQNQTVIG